MLRLFARATPRLPHPAGGNACFAGFFLDGRNGLGVLRDFLANAIEFGERFLAVAADLVALERVVAGREIGGQRVDPALQRFGEELCATERVPFRADALAPGLLVLLGFVCRVGRRPLCSCRGFLRTRGRRGGGRSWRRRCGVWPQAVAGVHLAAGGDRLAPRLLPPGDFSKRLGCSDSGQNVTGQYEEE